MDLWPGWQVAGMWVVAVVNHHVDVVVAPVVVGMRVGLGMGVGMVPRS